MFGSCYLKVQKMSKVYVLCGEGYEETIVFGVFNDEVCLRDAYYEVERYNIENITTRIYRFNLILKI